MVKRLGELGLVEHQPYRGVSLTEDGRRVALEVMRHHRLLELYLVQSLGVPWDRVHQEAEVLEHVLSDELEDLIAAKLGNPTHDPHGDPIPTRDLRIEEGSTESLQSLEAGATGTFVRVSDSDPEMLRFLADHGIAPGDALEVVDKQPFDGPLFVRFGDVRDPVCADPAGDAHRPARRDGGPRQPRPHERPRLGLRGTDHRAQPVPAVSAVLHALSPLAFAIAWP